MAQSSNYPSSGTSSASILLVFEVVVKAASFAPKLPSASCNCEAARSSPSGLNDRIQQVLNSVFGRDDNRDYHRSSALALGRFWNKQSRIRVVVSPLIVKLPTDHLHRRSSLIDGRPENQDQVIFLNARHEQTAGSAQLNLRVADLVVVQQTSEAFWQKLYYQAAASTSTRFLGLALTSTIFIDKETHPVVDQPTQKNSSHSPQSVEYRRRWLSFPSNSSALTQGECSLDLLRDLESASARYIKALNVQRHDQTIRQHSSGTCSWIFQHPTFNDWLDSQSNKVFWIQGKPGSGKSTLMSFLSRSLHQGLWPKATPSLSTSIFCERQVTRRRNVVNDSLCFSLQQILMQIPKERMVTYLGIEFWSEIEQDVDFGRITSVDVLVNHFEMLLDKVTIDYSVFLLIDGLDELEYSDANSLMAILRHITHKKRRHNFKLLISSRPHGTTSDRVVLAEDLGLILDEENQNDIINYLQDQFKNINLANDLQQNTLEATKKAAFEQILRKANGVFLWVTLVVKTVLVASGQDENIFDILDAFPLDLESVYATIWQRMVQYDLHQGHHVIRTLVYVLFAMRPLSPLELYDMMTDEPNLNQRLKRLVPWSNNVSILLEEAERFFDEFLSYSFGLVEIFGSEVGPNDRRSFMNRSLEVQIRHSSMTSYLHCAVRDHLSSSFVSSSGTVEKLQSAKSHIHFQMAEHCLVYLSVASKAFKHANITYENVKPFMPLIDYSCSYWVDHFEAAEAASPENTEIGSLFHTFQNAYLDPWQPISKLMPPNLPDWVCHAPPILCVSAHFGWNNLAIYVLTRHAGLNDEKLRLEQSNICGLTPLAIACESGHVKTVELLLRAGANFNGIDDTYGQSPLKRAASAGHSSVVRLLLDYGADVNDARNGTTALSQACAHGYRETAAALLEKGADPNLYDAYRGLPTLSLAVSNRHAAVASLLIQYGADVHQKARSTGFTALHHAIMSRSPQIVRLLIASGAEVKAIKAISLISTLAPWMQRVLFMVSESNHRQNVGNGDKNHSGTSKADACDVPSGTPTNITPQSSLRKRTKSPDDNDPEENGDDNPRKQLKPTVAPEKKEEILEFACPYWKRYPEMFESKPRCSTKGFVTIPELKLHLRRYHRNPQCERCGKSGFDGVDGEDKLEAHITDGTCNATTPPQKHYCHGYYRSQAREVCKRNRKKGDQDNAIYKDKWINLYRILFRVAEDEILPSPYFESLLAENKRLKKEIEALRSAYQRESQLNSPAILTSTNIDIETPQPLSTRPNTNNQSDLAPYPLEAFTPIPLDGDRYDSRNSLQPRDLTYYTQRTLPENVDSGNYTMSSELEDSWYTPDVSDELVESHIEDTMRMLPEFDNSIHPSSPTLQLYNEFYDQFQQSTSHTTTDMLPDDQSSGIQEATNQHDNERVYGDSD